MASDKVEGRTGKKMLETITINTTTASNKSKTRTSINATCLQSKVERTATVLANASNFFGHNNQVSFRHKAACWCKFVLPTTQHGKQFHNEAAIIKLRS
jgi:hypothetical protein